MFVKLLEKITLGLFILFISIFTVLSLKLINPNQVFAQATCDRIGQCVNDKKCVCLEELSIKECKFAIESGDTSVLTTDGSSPCGSAIIGGVTAPDAISAINATAGGDIGLIFFLSRAINFANIVAGILIMLNSVYAGFMYVIGAGSSSNMTKINERLTWSFIGVLLIVGSYTIAAIFGLIFYGNPTFIIAPTFTGALEL